MKSELNYAQLEVALARIAEELQNNGAMIRENILLDSKVAASA